MSPRPRLRMSCADAVPFGTPTRFGNVASPLKVFIDTAGALWQQGRLADRVFSAFTADGTAHGGQGSTILALSNTFCHWGGIIVPPGYTDPILFRTGNPYGVSHVASTGAPTEETVEAVRYQARRVVAVAAALKVGRASS
jgi:NAD(P)H dehydrogenase (quinone)